MNSTLRIISAVVISAALMTACGNAGAKNEKKKPGTPPAAVELTTESFNKLVYNLTSDKPYYLGDKPAIIDFNATWCGPCRKIAPILDELAKEYEGRIVIYKVDVDRNRQVAEAFNISSIPAILYIPTDSEPVMTIGLRGKGKMKEEIDTILLGKQAKE